MYNTRAPSWSLSLPFSSIIHFRCGPRSAQWKSEMWIWMVIIFQRTGNYLRKLYGISHRATAIYIIVGYKERADIWAHQTLLDNWGLAGWRNRLRIPPALSTVRVARECAQLRDGFFVLTSMLMAWNAMLSRSLLFSLHSLKFQESSLKFNLTSPSMMWFYLSLFPKRKPSRWIGLNCWLNVFFS